jgi:hypothetical protein
MNNLRIVKLKKRFNCLTALKKSGYFDIQKDTNYAEAIIRAEIPYQPGVYLVFSLDISGNENLLLYFGKAGVTSNKNRPSLNFHQLPARLLAATSIGCDHKYLKGRKMQNLGKKKIDITRAKIWPWYVKTKYKFGVRVYWFITDWFSGQDPNAVEKDLKFILKSELPAWKKLI